MTSIVHGVGPTTRKLISRSSVAELMNALAHHARGPDQALAATASRNFVQARWWIEANADSSDGMGVARFQRSENLRVGAFGDNGYIFGH